jgi:hypothetical protein
MAAPGRDHRYDFGLIDSSHRTFLIVDDFGLRRLSAQRSQDVYELIIERNRRPSFAFTSNRGRGRMARTLRCNLRS